MLKKLFLPIILVLSLTGCAAKEYDWVVKISDKEITPQQYISAQMHAYIEARNMADYDADIFAGSVDGVSTEQWMDNHTIEWLKRIIYIEDEFEKRNLKFGTDADNYINIFAQEGWENVEIMYKNNGLDFDYYMDYLKFLYKEQLVFNSIYVYGEESKVADREIESYLEDNLCRVSYFKIDKVNNDGTGITEDQEAQLDAVVSLAAERINNGEDIHYVAADTFAQSSALLGYGEGFMGDESLVTTEYITSSSIELIFDFMENFFEIPQEQCVYYKVKDCYYICQKRRLCDTQVEYMYLKQDVVNLIRDAEFEESIAKAGRQMDVEYNTEAMKIYTPQRLKMTID